MNPVVKFMLAWFTLSLLTAIVWGFWRGRSRQAFSRSWRRQQQRQAFRNTDEFARWRSPAELTVLRARQRLGWPEGWPENRSKK